MTCRLVLVFGCLAMLSSAKTPSTHKLDSSWKRYSNHNLGYCVNYPSRWLRGDAFDGAGMFFETGVKKYSRPSGEIDIEAFANPGSGQSEIKPVEYLQTHIEGLKKFERAENLEVLEQREIRLIDTSALFTKDRYFDPQDRTDWVDEIVLVKYKDVLYRLELECRADQLVRFEPVFSHFVSTFKFDCNGR